MNIRTALANHILSMSDAELGELAIDLAAGQQATFAGQPDTRPVLEPGTMTSGQTLSAKQLRRADRQRQEEIDRLRLQLAQKGDPQEKQRWERRRRELLGMTPSGRMALEQEDREQKAERQRDGVTRAYGEPVIRW